MPREDTGALSLGELEARLASLEAAVREKTGIETQLKESEERLALVLAGTNDGWWDWDLLTDKMYLSPRWWEIIGYGANELPPTRDTWMQLAHPDDVERVTQAYLAATKDGAGCFEVASRRRHKDGHWISVLTRGKVVTDGFGKPVRIAGTTTDLTEREQADGELRDAEERFRSMVELTAVGVLELDPEGRTTFANPRAAEMLDREPEAMRGRLVEEFLFPEDIIEHRSALARRRVKRRDAYERRMRRSDGSAVWVIVNATSLPSSDGGFRGSFATLTDITERKELEAARTAQLEELRRWYAATLGREQRIAELKREVNALSERIGVPQPYAEPPADAPAGGE